MNNFVFGEGGGWDGDASMMKREKARPEQCNGWGGWTSTLIGGSRPGLDDILHYHYVHYTTQYARTHVEPVIGVPGGFQRGQRFRKDGEWELPTFTLTWGERNTCEKRIYEYVSVYLHVRMKSHAVEART